MKNLILLCLSFSLTMAARRILDEEEFLDAKQFRDEALEVEREVAKLELLARQAADVAEVVPAPHSFYRPPAWLRRIPEQ